MIKISNRKKLYKNDIEITYKENIEFFRNLNKFVKENVPKQIEYSGKTLHVLMCLYAKCTRTFNSTFKLMMNGMWLDSAILCRTGINAFIDYKYIIMDNNTMLKKSNEFVQGKVIEKYNNLRIQCAIRSGESIKNTELWKDRYTIMKDYEAFKKTCKYFYIINNNGIVIRRSIAYKARQCNLNTLYLNYYNIYSMIEHSDVNSIELCSIRRKNNIDYIFYDSDDIRGKSFIDINMKMVNIMFYEITKEMCKFSHLNINSKEFEKFKSKYLEYISSYSYLIDNVSNCKLIAKAIFKKACIGDIKIEKQINDYFEKSEIIQNDFNLKKKIIQLEQEIEN